MAGIKISDVAKKAGKAENEVIETLKESGFEIAEDSTVSDDAVKSLGIDPKHLRLDRRQEMLKKAMERHKRHPKSREVKVGSNEEPSAPKKISKQELMDRKKKLEKTIRKVDENRETLKDEKLSDSQEPATETPVQPPSAKQPEPEAPKTETIKEETPVQEKAAKAPAEEPVKDTKPEAKTEAVKEQRQERPQRPQGDRPQRPQVDRPQRPQGDRQQSDRPPYRQGDRQQGDRPYRPKGGIEESAALAQEKKKVIKEKPKTEIDKKAKPVKPAVQKKEKNIHKGLDEGIELFELEQEILKSDDTSSEYKEPVEETEEKPVEKKPSHYDNRKKQGRRQKGRKREDKPEPVIVRPSSVVVGENIIVSELAKLMGVKATELIKKLMLMGVMASVNQAIDADTAVLLGAEYGIEVKVKFLTEDDLIPVHDDKPDELVPRPPIVTVMGHVDHGKTSLLDRIRQTAVAEGEAGGITQHIGAYEVKMEKGTITFLDTPGHEAFTTLRARGASVTDVVILVVAADDGVMPQTKEAIDHSKAAGVKLIVAINKIDKENANPDMVRNQLAEHGVISEDWGGDCQFQEISAKANLHIEDLLERVLLEAELLELQGNPDAPAEGIVIESKLDKQKGAVATVLINRGTLKKGDNFVVGTEFGKVRAMFNYKGAAIKEAGLSTPVEIMGFSGVPQSGDRFVVTPDEKTARQVADLRSEESRKKDFAEKSAVSLADLFNKIKEGELKELNIVLKADVQGSLEALKSSLVKLSNSEVKINIISSGVGGISENDVILANASNAVVIGFNVRPGVQARVKAEQEKIELNLYSVIYQAIDDVKQAMEGMLDPSKHEEVIGRAEVRQVFSVPKIGKIAGSYVTDGKVQRNAHVRVVRDSIVIYDGVLSSLKRFTDDVKEVAQGYECGIGVEKYNDLKEGDTFEFYVMVEEKRTLEDVRRDTEKREKAEAEAEKDK